VLHYVQKLMNKKIGVYICHCGTNIAATVDWNELARFSSTLPGVKVVRDYRYLCSDPGQDLIKKDIRELSIDRVVVAACSPRMHEMTFRNAISSEGLNPYLLNIANIREQCSWVHKDRERATEKAMRSQGGYDKTFLLGQCIIKANRSNAQRLTMPFPSLGALQHWKIWSMC